ncbi:sulfotransferase family protein [Cognatiluteimonas telluris]|uniref:sulfotransferase family protein n=1 Tax=Cognatiluteimonas telluris TaxID=1104775 RepID=UPI00140E92C1|nr:sulfotransferase [Lysobacter telluris]
MRQLHFISGLPRSGSTLLSALLAQNPRFHAGVSGPLAGLFGALLGEMSERSEFAPFLDDDKRQRVLRGVFDSYYADVDKPVIFDTSRGWCTRLPALAQLFPEAKVIACVRDLPWIFDSFERLVRASPFSPSWLFNFNPNGTVYTRLNQLASADGQVGYPFDALKEACFGEHAGQLLLVQYETLSSDPDRAMGAIYDFLGETPYAHDFDDVRYEADAFDRRLGTPNLHRVRGAVKAQPRVTLLPPDLFQRFAHDAFWRDPARRPAGLRIV